MNGEGCLRTTIGAMISHGLGVEAVRESLFLKGASEVWGGPAMDAHPAWYFWLTSSPGAYRLRLVRADRLDGHETPIVRGVFSVKYYPSPLEPVFGHFSLQEQALIQGDSFDQTNTPKPDAQVPDHLFNVGTIEFIRDLACEQSFFIYTSLNRLRFHGTRRSRPGGEHDAAAITAAPPRVRQLPAWDLGYPLFDAMVGLHAFLTREPPKRVILSRQSGMDFVEDEEGLLIARDSEETALASLLVAFIPEGGEGASSFEEVVTSRLLESPWKPVLDTAAWRRCHTASHHHGCNGGPEDRAGQRRERRGCGDDQRHMSHDSAAFSRRVAARGVVWDVPLALNEQWWALTTLEQAMNSMPCGCH